MQKPTCLCRRDRKLDLLLSERNPKNAGPKRVSDEHPVEDGATYFCPPGEIRSLGQGIRALTQHHDEPHECQRLARCRHPEKATPQDRVTVYIGPFEPGDDKKTRVMGTQRNGVERPQGSQKWRLDEIPLDVPAGTALTGIPLQGNKQKTFYQGICEIKVQNLDPRPSTTSKLAVVKM
ncbi:hypothetical protein DFH08DRAFT_814433 [Mycena albidolilacea]|uniref:Uncharacterized protein n=1 Tax=Mycena albidolilacea TaxID=1033008 RepID=A0AAD6ZPG1_9AGAR|nr:hypothetical protein DFH08DRAFT_814433 [Mycena albidolilacea]